MNIFALDYDPITAASYHMDKHVVKMILESAQLLCSVHHMTGGTAPYRLTHKNHPCSIWARESLSNYNWLNKLALALCDEYTYRYGKIHKSYYVIMELPQPNIPDIGLTPFKLAMPDDYKVSDPIESYRNYYVNDKRHIAAWKRDRKPAWYQ
jgi:hypothetical protein